ncbi:MAG TPA: spore coat protein CotJB [Clostridia bacterium]|nr:spore coat protein CotJB [Clostridia bacterium]
MIFDNMALPSNTLPLENIISPQNATNLQNMWAAQNNNLIPQNATALQNMMAQQNAATTQNTTASTQNSTGSTNQTRNMSTAATAQANRSGTNNKVQAKRQLAQSCFAVHEAVLYLDTHPNDQNALEYYRRKQQQLIQASDNYQMVVGPTRACAVDISSGSWRWVETPWPWETEED